MIILGWRLKIEDSHIAEDNLGNGINVFRVFDGHDGAEVTIYVK
jgi:hypothetical protein